MGGHFTLLHDQCLLGCGCVAAGIRKRIRNNERCNSATLSPIDPNIESNTVFFNLSTSKSRSSGCDKNPINEGHAAFAFRIIDTLINSGFKSSQILIVVPFYSQKEVYDRILNLSFDRKYDDLLVLAFNHAIFIEREICLFDLTTDLADGKRLSFLEHSMTLLIGCTRPTSGLFILGNTTNVDYSSDYSRTRRLVNWCSRQNAIHTVDSPLLVPFWIKPLLPSAEIPRLIYNVFCRNCHKVGHTKDECCCK